MTSEELAFVALEGRGVTYSHAVLIETGSRWYVEIEDLPGDSCPFLGEECRIAFDAWDGSHYAGVVSVGYRRDERAYLLLSGSGELERSCLVDPSAQDVEASV